MRRVRRVGPAAALAAVLALSLTGCTSTTDGSGGTGSGTVSPAPSAGSVSGGAGSTLPGTGTVTSATPSRTPVPRKRLQITGGSPQRTYDVTVWDSDDIADCSTHAYGATMIRFLGAHPCRGAHRVLATVPLNGRTVALSLISTSFPGTPTDPYATTIAFGKLEQADGTGAMNDLLREGGTLPGAQNIPPTEAFTVLSQDAGVTVFDAWYLTGTTVDQDPALVTLERNLYLTPLQGA